MPANNTEYVPPVFEVYSVYGRQYRKAVIDPPWSHGLRRKGDKSEQKNKAAKPSSEPELQAPKVESKPDKPSTGNETKSQPTTQKELVVNARSGKPYDVYVGRRHKDIVGSDWKWGNPFAIGRDGDRAEVIEKFEQWILEPEQAELLQEAKQTLAGKVLACWCSPLPCHGDVLARLANSGDESKASQKQPVDGDGYHILQEGPTNFFHRLEVAAESLPFLVGKNGSNLKAIMNDTSTNITVKDAENVLEIRGTSRGNVAEARTRLDISVTLAADKLPGTHFISVPLQDDRVQAKLGEFAEQALALKSSGLDRSILNPPKKLHLTCFVLRLHSPAQLAAAKNILQQATSELQAISSHNPLQLTLKHLAVMGDDVKNANVVYVKVAENEGLDKLKKLCKTLIERLQQADLLSPAEISHQALLDRKGDVAIKFHATVINTKNRLPAQPQRVPIDASLLFARLGGLDLGDITVPALHLSLMQGRTSDGYYPCAQELPLV